MKRRRLFASALCLVLLSAAAWLFRYAEANAEQPAAELPPAAKTKIDFTRHIQPLFAARCASCHGADAQEGDLRLDDRTAALRGSSSGAVIVAGDSSKSLLIRLVSGAVEEMRMPPEGEGKPLSAEEIGLLRAWIDQGAVWPDAAAGGSRRRGSDLWSLAEIKRPALPAVSSVASAHNPVDRFILARLEKEKISPSPEADRATLLRRAALDLIGLPPSPEEVEAFLKDRRPDAYERVVERLLASPHFGERWGRHWLDLARYADSDGYEKDRPRPFAWRYREWVISALNRDMPFDAFTVKQLAGDMLPDSTQQDRIATGFHRNTLHNTEGGIDPEEDRCKKTVDRTNTLGAVWLGLTVGCAQCHTHKYDPISHREYFGLYGFFNDMDEVDMQAPLPGSVGEKAKARSVSERKEPRKNYIHVRGNFLEQGAAVPAGGPEVLPPVRARGKRADRLDLARWIVDPANPLTPRVTVNRLWQRYFGRGLVVTSDDFGTQGEKPSHSELLDWLASELVARRWQMKDIHRLIVTSATYRQSSAARPELRERDPYNTLLARQIRQQVEAEIVRDMALAASGLFETVVGGPSVRPPQPKGIESLGYAGSVKWPVSQGRDRYRRGLYTFFQRTVPYPSLIEFGAPDSNAACVRRERADTPTMALTLWNDPVFVECAQALGRRIVRECPAPADSESAPAARIDRLFLTCVGRVPTSDERTLVSQLVADVHGLYIADEKAAAAMIGKESLPDGVTGAQLAAWIVAARSVMNLDEFIQRE